MKHKATICRGGAPAPPAWVLFVVAEQPRTTIKNCNDWNEILYTKITFALINKVKFCVEKLFLCAVALLLFLSVDRCYPLRTRRPSRAAQGPRPYNMSHCALYNCLKLGKFKVLVFFCRLTVLYRKKVFPVEISQVFNRGLFWYFCFSACCRKIAAFRSFSAWQIRFLTV